MITIPTQNPDYISVNELAQRLNLAPKTIRNWISAKKLTPTKMGGAVRFYWPDIQRRLLSKSLF